MCTIEISLSDRARDHVDAIDGDVTIVDSTARAAIEWSRNVRPRAATASV
jgi:hypothetical protein